MAEPLEREYLAIIWTKDPTVPGKRVSVWAKSLDEARERLEAEYGEGTVFYLRNEEDSHKMR